MLRNNHPFETFINDMGIWYSITLNFGDYKVVFRDSVKILNFQLRQIAKLFKMDQGKGETPILTAKPTIILKSWIKYIQLDVKILAHALHEMYVSEKFTKFTSSSEALKRYKETIPNFRNTFPVLEPKIDGYIRSAYKGGWTYAKKSIQGKIIKEKIDVYDINSMYPATMLNYELPYGYPEYFKGKPETEKGSVFVCSVWLNIKLKKGYLPTLQTKDTKTALALGVRKTDYIETTNDEFYKFTLTQYDLELIKKHYEHEIEYVDYYKFKAQKGMFDKYIAIYKAQKENASTPAEKQAAKIMLNGLYGKMGAKIVSKQKIVQLNDESVICFKPGEEEEVKPVYIPVACFVTSISRYFIITNAQANYKNFLYADTDSLHLITNFRKPDLDIHESRFGAWKKENENVIVLAKYLRSKLYIEIDYLGNTEVKGAGMTEAVKKQVTIDNFVIGATFTGKLQPKRVVGGVILEDRTFTIKKGGLMF